MTAGQLPLAIPAALSHDAVIGAVRSRICNACWAPAGTSCTVAGPPGDHLARYLDAERRGDLDRAAVTAAVMSLTVLAHHVIIPEGPAS